MRKTFCLILCVLTLACTTIMTACSKDDWDWFVDIVGELDDIVNDSTRNDGNDVEEDDDLYGNYPQLIQGAWKVSSHSITYPSGSVVNGQYKTAVFTPDHQVTFTEDYNSGSLHYWNRYNGTYSVSGNTIYLTINGISASGTIKELTSQRLVFYFWADGYKHSLTCNRQ